MRKEIEGLNHDTDWYRYHGYSTVYTVGKSGLSIHMPDPGESGEADRFQDGPEGKGSYGLGTDHDKDSNREGG